MNAEPRAPQTGLRFRIVTPVLNQGRFIAAAVYSVLCQEGPFSIDYRVCDGGSTDGTVEALRAIEARLAEGRVPVRCGGVRFDWDSHPDAGQYDAIQRGFQGADGAVMGWLNADDMLVPGALNALATVFTRYPDVEWVSGDATRMNAAGVIAASDHRRLFPRALIRRGLFDGRHLPFIQQESTYWRRGLWERSGARLRTELVYAADFELWMRFAETAELVKLHAPIGVFRVHGGQKSARLREYFQEVDRLRRLALRDRLGAALRRRLLPLPTFGAWAMFPHAAEVVYYSFSRGDWVRRRAYGGVRRR